MQELNDPAAIGNTFIDMPKATEAFEQLDELMKYGWQPRWCRALLIVGPSRCGKTHIFSEWLRRRAKAAESNGTRFASCETEIPAQASLRSAASTMLESLRHPDITAASQPVLTRRVIKLAKDIGLNVIVIDELQNMLNADTDKLRGEVARWVCTLLNKRVCPLVLVGETIAESVFETKYLSGRLFGKVVIGPYDWHAHEQQLQFRTFLNLLEPHLGMPEPCGLGSVDLAYRIFVYSEGRLGQATQLVDKTRATAQRLGRPKLTYDIFADAVDRLRIGAESRLENPFRVERPGLLIDAQHISQQPQICGPR